MMSLCTTLFLKNNHFQVLSSLSGSSAFTIQSWEDYNKAKVINVGLNSLAESNGKTIENNGKVTEHQRGATKRTTPPSNGVEAKKPTCRCS